jgi:GntR family transcriptional regulator/MocR family aminotransferase
LAPGLGLGWMLSPSWLTGGLTYEQGISSGTPPVLDQLAVADFLARGELDRHLRRMRAVYRRRRDALVAALSENLPRARASGAAAGVFTWVELPLPVSGETLAAAAAARGVGLELPVREDGFALGFGHLPEPAISAGVHELELVLDELG